jgi:hypothetical protein
MRRSSVLLALLALLPLAGAPAQPARPPNQRPPLAEPLPPIASYQIDVSYDRGAQQLRGRERVTFRNASNRPISELGWHLYLNAFRDEDTVFNRESGAQLRGDRFDPAHAGWIEIDGLRLHEGADLLPGTRISETVMTTTLPIALAPGATITLGVDFHAQLPRVYARSGYYEDFVLAGQWFPKLAVHDDAGWHNFDYHGWSEFFADFGDYDVAITLPAGDVTGASGRPAGPPVDNGDGSQTVRYTARNVIDFVWTASPRFAQATRAAGDVELVLLYQPEHAEQVERYFAIAAAALEHFGRRWGPYPYDRLTIVDPPAGASGAAGMEYPMFVTGGTPGLPMQDVPQVYRVLEAVVAHEVGHQWFGMTAASNEAAEPWLDEGFTEYITDDLLAQRYGRDRSMLDLGPLQIGAYDERRLMFLADPAQPIAGAAWELADYPVSAYAKPLLALRTLEGLLGAETFDRVLATYYGRYRFRHPTAGDFRAVAEEVSGRDLGFFFEQVVAGSELVDYAVTAIGPHEVTVARLGDVTLPVTVEVRFADGASLRQSWNGAGAEQRFRYPDREVVAAAVSPDGELALDANRANDSLAIATVEPAWKALLRWLFWMQNLVITLGVPG